MRRPRRPQMVIWCWAWLLTGVAGAGCNASDAVQPRTGWWDYTHEGITGNTCGTDQVYTDPDTTFWLTNHSDDTFTVEQGSRPSFDCTVDGDAFTCPQRLAGTSPVQGYDAELNYHVSVTGVLHSRTSMSGTQQFEVSCQGSQCDLAPLAGWTLPCVYTVAFTATAR